jgi:FtsH-binding integral membrane protein
MHCLYDTRNIFMVKSNQYMPIFGRFFALTCFCLFIKIFLDILPPLLTLFTGQYNIHITL